MFLFPLIETHTKKMWKKLTVSLKEVETRTQVVEQGSSLTKTAAVAASRCFSSLLSRSLPHGGSSCYPDTQSQQSAAFEVSGNLVISGTEV
jgi:hypothetical protein